MAFYGKAVLLSSKADIRAYAAFDIGEILLGKVCYPEVARNVFFDANTQVVADGELLNKRESA